MPADRLFFGVQYLARGSYGIHVLLFTNKQRGTIKDRWFYQPQMSPRFLQVSANLQIHVIKDIGGET